MMSDQWLYRIYGQEFGPVSLDLVRSLVSSGTIAPDDEVRNVTRSNWILACAAAELSNSLQARDAVPEVERRVVRDEWFCRGYAGDYGPLKLSDLIQLAVEGELQPDEEIKSRADDYWRKVCSIRRLVELLPFPEQSGRLNRIRNRIDPVQSSVTDQIDILPFPGASFIDHLADTLASELNDERVQTNYLDEVEHLTEAATRPFTTIEADDSPSYDATKEFADTYPLDDETESEAEQDQMESSLRVGNDQWTGWIAGEEFGPVNYTELLMWAVTGRLSPTDFVRRGEEGQYVPAVNIPCLFTVRAAANSLSRRVQTPALKIADVPADRSEPEETENESTELALTDENSTLLEAAASGRRSSFEARLHHAVSSLQKMARQFASRILNQAKPNSDSP